MGLDLRRLWEEGGEDGDADRFCCSRSFSRSPRRMYLVVGGAAVAEADVLASEEAEASSAALRLLAISALRKSILNEVRSATIG